MKPARAQMLLYIQTSVTLAVSMVILIWLHQIYTNYRDRSLEDIQGLFSRDEIIKPRYDINFQFRRVESLAKTVRASMFVEDIYVVKMLEDRGEHVIHPFHAAITDPDWQSRLAGGWLRFPLVQGGEVYGVLYIREDTTPLTSVRVAIGLLGALLLLTLALFMVRLLTQQSQLHGAYVALEEKDRQMIQLERLALAGQLTANILHDIKKPVANIKHTLPELDEFFRELAGGSPALRNIKEQTDLFFSILKDLGLERFVRSRDQDREYLDLNNMLRQSCALVQYERKAVEVQWELDGDEPLMALAQPYRLIQVFSNLILNAYQAMEGKGQLILRSRAEASWAVVEVMDDGPGVDPTMAHRLFEPFESSKPEGEGAGLGLYISRNIVADLGGTLELAPSEWGARFVVRLPLVAAE